MTRRYCGIVLSVIGALVIPVSAQAGAPMLCSNPSGLVFVRDTSCRPSEQPVDVDSLGLMTNNAYTFSARTIPLTKTATTVAEVVVPAGQYVVNAYAFVHNFDGAHIAPIICSITTPRFFDFVALVLQPFVSGPNISSGSLAFNSVADLQAGANISMQCYNNTVASGANAQIDIVRLTGTRVGSLIVQ